jgi:hypothetical protein
MESVFHVKDRNLAPFVLLGLSVSLSILAAYTPLGSEDKFQLYNLSNGLLAAAGFSADWSGKKQ